MLLWSILKRAAQRYLDHGNLSRGAAIAFYTVTSLAPLLLIVIAIAGLAIGQDAARSGVIDPFRDFVGAEGADLIKSIVVRSSDPASGTTATVFGVLMVLVTASGIFGEMQSALNTTWEAEPPDEPWWSLVRARATSLGLVAALGVVTMVSLAASAALSALGRELAMRTPVATVLLSVLNTALSLAVFALLFAAWIAWARYRALGYAVFDDYLVARAGVWTRRWWIVPKDQVQTLVMTRDPMQRVSGLATLVIDTAGAAGHSVARIVDLDVDRARSIFDDLLQNAARTSWGGGLVRPPRRNAVPA